MARICKKEEIRRMAEVGRELNLVRRVRSESYRFGPTRDRITGRILEAPVSRVTPERRRQIIETDFAKGEYGTNELRALSDTELMDLGERATVAITESFSAIDEVMGKLGMERSERPVQLGVFGIQEAFGGTIPKSRLSELPAESVMAYQDATRSIKIAESNIRNIIESVGVNAEASRLLSGLTLRAPMESSRKGSVLSLVRFLEDQSVFKEPIASEIWKDIREMSPESDVDFDKVFIQARNRILSRFDGTEKARQRMADETDAFYARVRRVLPELTENSSLGEFVVQNRLVDSPAVVRTRKMLAAPDIKAAISEGKATVRRLLESSVDYTKTGKEDGKRLIDAYDAEVKDGLEANVFGSKAESVVRALSAMSSDRDIMEMVRRIRTDRALREEINSGRLEFSDLMSEIQADRRVRETVRQSEGKYRSDVRAGYLDVENALRKAGDTKMTVGKVTGPRMLTPTDPRSHIDRSVRNAIGEARHEMEKFLVENAEMDKRTASESLNSIADSVFRQFVSIWDRSLNYRGEVGKTSLSERSGIETPKNEDIVRLWEELHLVADDTVSREFPGSRERKLSGKTGDISDEVRRSLNPDELMAAIESNQDWADPSRTEWAAVREMRRLYDEGKIVGKRSEWNMIRDAMESGNEAKSVSLLDEYFNADTNTKNKIDRVTEEVEEFERQYLERLKRQKIEEGGSIEDLPDAPDLHFVREAIMRLFLRGDRSGVALRSEWRGINDEIMVGYEKARRGLLGRGKPDRTNSYDDLLYKKGEKDDVALVSIRDFSEKAGSDFSEALNRELETAIKLNDKRDPAFVKKVGRAVTDLVSREESNVDLPLIEQRILWNMGWYEDGFIPPKAQGNEPQWLSDYRRIRDMVGGRKLKYSKETSDVSMDEMDKVVNVRNLVEFVRPERVGEEATLNEYAKTIAPIEGQKPLRQQVRDYIFTGGREQYLDNPELRAVAEAVKERAYRGRTVKKMSKRAKFDYVGEDDASGNPTGEKEVSLSKDVEGTVQNVSAIDYYLTDRLDGFREIVSEDRLREANRNLGMKLGEEIVSTAERKGLRSVSAESLERLKLDDSLRERHISTIEKGMSPVPGDADTIIPSPRGFLLHAGVDNKRVKVDYLKDLLEAKIGEDEAFVSNSMIDRMKAETKIPSELFSELSDFMTDGNRKWWYDMATGARKGLSESELRMIDSPAGLQWLERMEEWKPLSDLYYPEYEIAKSRGEIDPQLSAVRKVSEYSYGNEMEDLGRTLSRVGEDAVRNASPRYLIAASELGKADTARIGSDVSLASDSYERLADRVRESFANVNRRYSGAGGERVTKEAYKETVRLAFDVSGIPQDIRRAAGGHLSKERFTEANGYVDSGKYEDLVSLLREDGVIGKESPKEWLEWADEAEAYSGIIELIKTLESAVKAGAYGKDMLGRNIRVEPAGVMVDMLTEGKRAGGTYAPLSERKVMDSRARMAEWLSERNPNEAYSRGGEKGSLFEWDLTSSKYAESAKHDLERDLTPLEMRNVGLEVAKRRYGPDYGRRVDEIIVAENGRRSVGGREYAMTKREEMEYLTRVMGEVNPKDNPALRTESPTAGDFTVDRSKPRPVSPLSGWERITVPLDANVKITYPKSDTPIRVGGSKAPPVSLKAITEKPKAEASGDRMERAEFRFPHGLEVPKDYVVIDLETNISKDSPKVYEIAAVNYSGRKADGSRSWVNSEHRDEILKDPKFSEGDFDKNGADIATALEGLSELIRGKKIVGHNFLFDREHLLRELKAVNATRGDNPIRLPEIEDVGNIIDTGLLYKGGLESMPYDGSKMSLPEYYDAVRKKASKTKWALQDLISGKVRVSDPTRGPTVAHRGVDDAISTGFLLDWLRRNGAL